ncbi:adenylyltransferase/cytidyltransferase family protein [Alphaproteobacteria bacterium]|nr:adenylyltransferase/cytidyltransferase family protein [Alphaproteobacteria bacterium]
MPKNKIKIVYAGMAADLIHHGHINLIKKARKYGKLIVGVLSDEAIITYKRRPVYNYYQRKLIFENIKGVEKVIKQKTLSYVENLKKIKPDFVIHGNDWKKGVQSNTRQDVIDIIAKWDGKLIEVPYTKNISTTIIIKKLKNK